MFYLLGNSFLDRHLEKFEREMETAKEVRLARAVDWDSMIPWEKYLTVKADSYQAWALDLFPELKVTDERFPIAMLKDVGATILSSDECWFACRRRFPRGEYLSTVQDNSGRRKGTVMFDKDISITALHYRPNSTYSWMTKPMMSFTPFEVFTLRSGTKLAKGHVVLGGLGLGYQLVEVSKRKQVTKITVIEKSQSLVELMMPRLQPLIQNGHEIDIIIGDVYEELPKLTADVALIDIFPGFPQGLGPKVRLRKVCSNVKTIWCWGGGAPA